MKPHEETWAVFKSDAGGWVASHNGDGPIVVIAMGNSVAQQTERAALVAAAPEMARALVGMLSLRGDGSYHVMGFCTATSASTCDNPQCVAVRAALIKSGVPL